MSAVAPTTTVTIDAETFVSAMAKIKHTVDLHDNMNHAETSWSKLLLGALYAMTSEVEERLRTGHAFEHMIQLRADELTVAHYEAQLADAREYRGNLFSADPDAWIWPTAVHAHN
jgi:hypothetical protein